MKTQVKVSVTTEELAKLIIETVREHQLQLHTFEVGALATMLSRSGKCDFCYQDIKNKIHELIIAGQLKRHGYWGLLGVPELCK